MTNGANLVQKPSEGVPLSHATIESLARFEPTPNAQQRRGLARGVASLVLSKAALIEASHKRRHSGPSRGEVPLLTDRLDETSTTTNISRTGDQVFRRGGELEMSRFEFLMMIAETRAAAAQELIGSRGRREAVVVEQEGRRIANASLVMRKTDSGRRPRFRSKNRFFRHAGKWHFQTRERVRGPFDSRKAAELELQRYIDTMEYVEGNEASLPSDVDWSDVTLVDIDKPDDPY